jgi:hypothetical protein
VICSVIHYSKSWIIAWIARTQMRKPFLLEYPTGNKLGIVCCLDGDVEDRTSNEFRLSNDGMTMTRMRRVLKACSSGSFLLKGIDGENKEEGFMPGFGSTDIDVQVIDSAIQKRMIFGNQGM